MCNLSIWEAEAEESLVQDQPQKNENKPNKIPKQKTKTKETKNLPTKPQLSGVSSRRQV
jgi:hypothetical protein